MSNYTSPIMKIKIILFFIVCVSLNTLIIHSQEIYITPRPQKISKGDNFLKISSETHIVFDDTGKTIAKNLQQYFGKGTGPSARRRL